MLLKTIEQQKLFTIDDIKDKEALEECILRGYIGCLSYSVYLKYEGMVYIQKFELIQKEFFNKTPSFMIGSGFENPSELI